MGQARLIGSGGGKSDLSFVTAGAEQILKGYTGSDNEGRAVSGDIDVQSASGNVTLNDSLQTKSYPAGFYSQAHGATVVYYNGEVE